MTVKAPVTLHLEPKLKNPNSLFFTGQEARDILYGDNEKFETVEDIIIDKSRWSIHHKLVVNNVETGKFYIVSYSKGATENQDEQPWEYDNEVEFVEAEPYEETVIRYRVKK